MLYPREPGTQELIGQLFAVVKKTVSSAIADVAPLLDQHRHHVTVSFEQSPDRPG